MDFRLNNYSVPNGTILIIGIQYPPREDDLDTTRGRRPPKTFHYVLTKQGGLWYTTGAGQVPQAAGWGAVEKWLARDNRELVSVEAVVQKIRMWPEVGEPVWAPSMQAALTSSTE